MDVLVGIFQINEDQEMLEQIDLQPAEKALEKARAMMTKIQESSVWWPDKEAFEGDLETASRLLAEMQQALSDLIVQLSEHADVVYGQGFESEVGEAIHKSYNLLSQLYDDLHAIEDDGPDGSAGKDTFEQARVHVQQITSHYALTRDRLLALEKELGMDG
jgi:hypothetical protein